MATGEQRYGEWPLKRLMTEVVGSGPKSAEDMSREQAREAFQRILGDEPDATTLGAFWLANRWKRNDAEELGTYVDVMREETVRTAEPDCDPLDCGANYDGKGRSMIFGVAAGVVAAAAGTPVVAHSGDRVPTQKQDAYKHVLDELGVRTDLEPEESAEMVDDAGFGFYYQPNFAPGIDDLFERRDAMGVRTFVNTVETLANPANADVHLGSFYHLAFAKKVCDTFKESRESDVSKVVMFQGMEGYDDVRPGYTKVAEWRAGEAPRASESASSAERSSADHSSGRSPREDGDEPRAGEDELNDFEIETAEYGMDVEEEDLQVEDVAADSARITEAVLAGDREDAFADAVALNAALRMYARDDVESIQDGIDEARAVIDDGSAQAVLDDLRGF